MEVNKTSFYPLLLDILTDLSEAHFVAFDLELSGVPSKGGAKNTRGHGKPTLQERYAETKEAAERYQILQIGLTCVQQDLEHGKYILKPYNFELSPLIEERGLDVERIFSFQSGAVEFLLNVGFDLSVPFKDGIPYLSRTECREAREKFARRNDKSTFEDIQIKPTELESLAFLDKVRSAINSWIKSRKPETLEYVMIGKNGDYVVQDGDVVPDQGLSRFEKRLVHQLVRAEYPELVTISRGDGIRVIRFDKEREDKIAAQRKQELEEKINRQKGFRWIIEAMHGSAITSIDLKECARDPLTGEHIVWDPPEYRAQFHRAATLLRGNPRRLVGHNCFLDLVYIYRMFIGDLPDSVEEFQRKVHNLWPMIVDTKYMSTHNCGDINPVSSLEQISSQLSAEQQPILEVDKEHTKYANVENFHEAGYDSFMTAQIVARLSAKLEREGSYVDTNGSKEDDQPKADNGMNDSNGVEEDVIANGVNGMKLTETTLDMHDYHTENGTLPPSQPDGFIPSEEGLRWKRRGDPTLAPPDPNDPFEYNPKDLKHRHLDEDADKTFKGGMPRFGSDFWRVYGNKLRVFGTQEGVCLLDHGLNDLTEDDTVENGQGGVAVDAV